MIAGIKDCVEVYAKRRGISKSQAETEFRTAVDVIADMCVDGGVSFKGIFTIKKKVQKGRSGVCKFNNKEWKTEDKNTLAITVGNGLEEELNR